ncbi:MAG: hypothetical protein JJE42_14085 [Burkholderiales bacterium]|nr:hypothetical protein [Burkholderiales bacterium]
MNSANAKTSTAQVKADKGRIDRLKEQLRSTPAEVDFERIRIMEEVYAATQGDQNIMRRAKFMATLFERKKLYIDDNLFVGSMARNPRSEMTSGSDSGQQMLTKLTALARSTGHHATTRFFRHACLKNGVPIYE